MTVLFQVKTLHFPATADYNPSPFTITLSASQTRACIQVPIVNDVLAEDNEVFQVSLSTNQFATSVVGIATATVTISDNDQGQLNFVLSASVI